MTCRRTLFCITVIITIVGLFGGCDKLGISGDATGTVTGTIGKRVDEYLAKIVPFGFSGAALVAHGDEILLNKGYGLANVEAHRVNTSGTIFSVGSITKQFTAAAIMKLEMMGELNTADPISQYFENVPQDKKDITLHHLLTHTSGMPAALGHDFEVIDRDSMMHRILEAPLEFAPGEDFGYSNCGYSMLAAVVELTSGQTYEEFLNEHLFKPAGMESTGYRLPHWDTTNVSHWYAGEVDNGIPLDKDYPYWNYVGNGGILSTTSDMLKWHQALLGNAILSDEAKAKLYTPYLNDYAYGWDVLDTDWGTLIQHDGGSMLGCAADFKRFIDSNIVIMLFANRSGEEMLMKKGVRDKVCELVFNADLELPLEPKEIEADLSKYEGHYLLDSASSYIVTPVLDRLQVMPLGKKAISAFYMPDEQLLLQVESNENRSREVLAAAIKDDFEPFRVLVHDDQRLERIKQLWYMRSSYYADMTGPLKTAEVKFSMPSGYAPGATETMMEVVGDSGSFFYRMIWKGGEMIGIAPSMPPAIGVSSLWPLGEDKFFTYDIATSKNILVDFKGDDLLLVGRNESLKATRQ